MTKAEMSVDQVIDGVQIAVEGRSNTSLLGRSVLVGDVSATGPGYDPGIVGALKEAADAGWPNDALTGQLDWLALGQAGRDASVSNDELTGGQSGRRHHFGSDPEALRPPWPVDLLSVPPAYGRAPYAGPRGVRLWLNSLHPRPGEPQTSFAVGDAKYERESLHSMIGASDFALENVRFGAVVGGSALVSPSTFSVIAGLQPGQGAKGAGAVQLFAPLRSIRQIDFVGEWSTIRPWRGADKQIVTERGYSPINKSSLQVTFSDGWRVARITLRYDRHHNPRVQEGDVIGLAETLIGATRRAQGLENDPVALPHPDRSGPEEMCVRLESSIQFDRAVHFAITVSPTTTTTTDTEPATPPAKPTSDDDRAEQRPPGARAAQPPPPGAATVQPPPPATSAQPPPPLVEVSQEPPTRPGEQDATVIRVSTAETAMHLPEIGFGCSEKMMPEPLRGVADAMYIGAISGFKTSLPILDHPSGKLGVSGVEIGSMEALFAAALYQRTMAVITRPLRGQGPSYWIRIPLADADIASAGQRGIVKKRPNGVVVGIDNLAIGCIEVKRFWPGREAMQPWQEADMLAELLSQQRS